jgi:hypothetical protein
VYARYTRGGTGFMTSDYQYNRYDLLTEKQFKIKNLGDLSITALGGYIPGNLPLSLLYNARGSWNKSITIATPGAFETMRTNEFQSNQFAAMHIRHNFHHLLFKTKKFQPQFQAVHNMMWGKIDHTDLHSFPVQAPTKGYFESGVQVDGLLKNGLANYGLGVFYRYGPYHLPKTITNFALKLTTTFVF